MCYFVETGKCQILDKDLVMNYGVIPGDMVSGFKESTINLKNL